MDYIVLAIAKDEPEIKDWVNHHLNIGFNKIIIGDNGLTYSQLNSLSTYRKSKLVEVINIRDKKFYQLPFYSSQIIRLQNSNSWIAVIDCDEYIRINTYNIKQFIEQYPKNTGMIQLHWMMYGSYRTCEDRLNCIPYDSHEKVYTKSIYNMKAPISDWIGEHNGDFKGSSNGWCKRVSPDIIFDENIEQICRADYRFGWIEHRYYIGLEGWVQKCLRRFANSDDSRKIDDFIHLKSQLDNSEPLEIIRDFYHKQLITDQDIIDTYKLTGDVILDKKVYGDNRVAIFCMLCHKPDIKLYWKFEPELSDLQEFNKVKVLSIRTNKHLYIYNE